MSQLAAINYSQLEEFLSNDGATEEEVRLWFERLSDYDIDGTETLPEIELLYNGARYVMNFGFTAAEELRDVADQEAVTMAEKEDQWEEQKASLNQEIDSLRDRITSKAEIGNSTEAFRAQIDSLKEENRQLQQSNRDRDREMADQRDRFENLSLRVDALTRERDALSDHKGQLEDTIRELNRRLSAKTEDTGGDWESKKLKLRNEQVLTMSRQMQAAEGQNEELREEIERVSNALESANKLIEQTAKSYMEMTNKLEVSQLRVEELYQQNRRLTQMLPEDLVDHINRCTSAAEGVMSGNPMDRVHYLMEVAELLGKKFMNDEEWMLVNEEMGVSEMEGKRQEIERQRDKIQQLQEELNSIVEESNTLRLMIREDRTGEKEQVLEQLRKELVDATTLARNLFGEAMSNVPGQDPTTTLQMRIIQLEHSLEQLYEERENTKKTIEEMQFTIEKKDENNIRILGELNTLKDVKFGSAREEITRLETQIKFREEQIGKLQQHCTLLQVELGRYADGSYKAVMKPKTSKLIKRTDKLLTRRKEEQITVEKGMKQTEEIEKPSPRVIEDEAIDLPVVVSSSHVSRDGDYSDVAQQAVLISNLYYEMMQLLEEISYKDEKLIEMQKSWKITQKSYLEIKVQMELAYEEIKKLKQENILIEEKTLNEWKQTESVELQRLVESINTDGSELERRIGEATRMLVTERIERMRYNRQNTILKTKVERLEDGIRRSRDTMREKELRDQRTIARLKYEMDMATIEVGKLQTRVLQSVPTEEYDKLMRKYKRIIKEGAGIETNNEEIPRPELIVFAKDPVEAETEARENMLKKMIDVVSDQGDFWNQEAAMLQAENEELKKFIEDVENESDLKSVLGAVERRLLATIRELRENEREYIREKKKQRGMDGEAIRDSERLKHERMALLNVINVLQRENKQLRDQSVGTVSLQQLETLRTNIFNARQKETEISFKMSEVDKMKEEAETEILRARALRTANEVISSFDGRGIQQGNNEMTERQMQMALFNASQQSAKAKQMERMAHLKEKRMAELNDEIRELKNWNLELITTLENVKDFKSGGKKTTLQNETENISHQIDVPALNLKNSFDKESDDEMEVKSETSTSSGESSKGVFVRTIVQDNVEVFENRIKEIRTSAQLALQGYKEQLELKEIAIERYKQMLKEKIEEGVKVIEKVEIVHEEVKVPDKETEEKLRKSEQKLKELEVEVKRLKTTSKRTQGYRESSREKTEDVKEFQEAQIQTDYFESMPHSPLHSGASRLNNSNEEDIPKSAKSEKMRRMEEEMQLMQELVAKSDSKDSENMRQKSEIRDLKARIQRLTKTNKELMITCEQIKEDALAELSTFRRNNENSDERRMSDLRIELERLRSTNKTLRNSNEEFKIEMNRIKDLVEKRNNKNEPDEWEKRKRQEEVIVSLRERIKKKETVEKELTEKLEKRERLIETMKNDQGLRSSEIERLQRKIKANDPDVLKKELSIEWKAKIDVLETRLTKKNEELQVVIKNLTKSRTELETIKSRHLKEVERIKVENKETILNEVSKVREEMKQSLTLIRPLLLSREIQTESLSKSEEEERRRHGSIPYSTSSSSSSSSLSSSVVHTIVSPKSTRVEERRRSSGKSIGDQNSPKFSTNDYYQLKESLQMTQFRLVESQEKLIKMESDYTALYEKFERLQVRKERDEKPTGAVLVLSDKLAAKDREIAQLKTQIAHFQRTIHLPISL